MMDEEDFLEMISSLKYIFQERKEMIAIMEKIQDSTEKEETLMEYSKSIEDEKGWLVRMINQL